jgi:hypothetical protein
MQLVIRPFSRRLHYQLRRRWSEIKKLNPESEFVVKALDISAEPG